MPIAQLRDNAKKALHQPLLGFWVNRSSSENNFLGQQRELLAQGKQQKTQEYFVYFKFYGVQAWDSRAAAWAKSNF